MIFLRIIALCAAVGACASVEYKGSGDLGVIIERAVGSVLIVNTTTRSKIARVEGLGDLSHASAVYSRDEHYVYVFGRDGGLSKIDILAGKLVNRVVQGDNAIGGAVSQDGRLIAVSNYTPGGVRVFDAETLKMVADIPAVYGTEGKASKTVGLVDAPGRRFVFTLYDGGEIWLADLNDPAKPVITKYKDIGSLPYDALITPGGHYYIAGLFGEDGMALLDLWKPEAGVTRILGDYGKGSEKLPVYKMPHLEGWAVVDGKAFVPAVGRNEVLIIDTATWKQAGSIPVHGQPIFVAARPDGRHIWVNFALPNNDVIQIIDVATNSVVKELTPGKGVLHMEFTPRGEEVWVSVRDIDRVLVYDTADFHVVKELPADKPSGIFFTSRAHRIGL